MKIYLFPILLLSLHAQSPDYTQRLAGFDAWLENAVTESKVPGLAIAIVAEGKVILSKGYGYRDVSKKLPVTPQTLFAIGSVTKSFTVATLGTLAAEGKFDWDKPVREYLPGFRMFDATVTDQLTTRDMVTHRSGLPRHDLVWYSSEFPLSDLVRRLRYLPPSQPLRARYQYNNLMYAAAGHVAAIIADKPWTELVRERLFVPLEMTHSRMNLEEAAKSGELALPYKRDPKRDAVQEIPPFANMTVAPAGSIYSCVADMAKYLQMHLDGGKGVVTANTIQQMHAIQIPTPGSPYPEIEAGGYGMGLIVGHYRGRKNVAHGGSIDGMRAAMSFLPKEKLGVIVLWNLQGSPIGDMLPYVVFDRLLGAPETDWLGRAKAAEAAALAQMRAAEGRKLTGQRAGTQPSHPLADFAGLFEHPGYGRMTLTATPAGLSLKFNKIERPLEHFHYDTFQVPPKEFDQFARFKLSFVTNSEGDIDRLRANLDANVEEINFTRVAEPAMFEKPFLSRFSGEYENTPKPLIVTLQGTSQLLLGGTKLLPLYGTRFRLDGQTGVSVEFRGDASGRVTEMVTYSPAGAFVRRKN